MTNINEHLEQTSKGSAISFSLEWQSLQIHLSSLEYIVSLNCSVCCSSISYL